MKNKTRRGFFTALAGAVVAPFLLAKTALAKSVDPGYQVGDEHTETLAPGDTFSIKSVNCYGEVTSYTVESAGSGWVPDEPWTYFEGPLFKIWPDPPVYPLTFQWSKAQDPNSWDALDFGPVPYPTIIVNPDGTTKSVTINQTERGNS